MAKRPHGKGLKLYKSYNFRDKDPIIDVVHGLVDRTSSPLARLERDSGVTANTLRNWFNGPTKRPQFCTVCAVVRAMGYDIRIGDKAVVSRFPVAHSKRRTK